MLFYLHPHDRPGPAGRRLTPTPEQLHRLDRIWVDLCARAGAGPIPMRLDSSITGHASCEGGFFPTLYAHPDLAELSEPAQRWVLGRQLGRQARFLLDERRRAWTYLVRAGNLALTFVLVPALALFAGPHTWWHTLGLVAMALAGVVGAAVASGRYRFYEHAADAYAHHELGLTLTPDILDETATPAWPWPRLAWVLAPWSLHPTRRIRLAAHGPDPHDTNPRKNSREHNSGGAR